MPRFVTLMQRSHKKSLSDFRSRWKSQGVNLKFLSVTIVKLTTIVTQGKKKLGSYDNYKCQNLLIKVSDTNLGKCPPPLCKFNLAPSQSHNISVLVCQSGFSLR